MSPIAGVAVALLAVLVGFGCVKSTYDPSRSQTRLELAQTRLAAQDLDSAETEATQAIRYDSNNADAYLVRGLVHYMRARRLAQILEIDGCIAGVEGEALRDEHDAHLAKAVRDFERAYRADPKNTEALSNLGIIANLQGDAELAKKTLQVALKRPEGLLSPSLTRAHLGWAHFHAEEYGLAAKELLTALQESPGMCVATYRLGRVSYARGEYDKATERFLQLVETPECAAVQEGYLYLMRSLTQQGLLADARAARDACLARSPKSCVALTCKTEGPAAQTEETGAP